MALSIRVPSLEPILHSSTPAASPPSRPHSPHTGYRPSSRSERLLRDTLRKADERQPSLTHRTSYSRPKSGDRSRPFQDEPQELDEGLWLSNNSQAANILRRQSLSHPSSRCPSPQNDMPPLSSSPPPSLSRTQTAPSPLHYRSSSSQSSMPIPHPMTPKPVSPTPSSSWQRNSSIIPLAPHEAILRSRLEGVLSRVNSLPQCQPEYGPTGSLKSRAISHALRTNAADDRVRHSRSQSLAGSPVVQGEWPWSASGSFDSPDAQPHQQLTPPPTPPSNVTSLTPSPLSPATPPSPFNARAANQICRQMPAYVSFQDVEGLGEPPHEDGEECDEDDKARNREDRKWWNWPWSGRARAQSR